MALPNETAADARRLLLVVEDDESLSHSLARSFERRGYRVLRADSLESVETLLARGAEVGILPRVRRSPWLG